MHSRERGAVHIMAFLFMLVLFLGALFFAYAQLTENTDLKQRIAVARNDAAQAKAEILTRDHLLEEFKPAVGELGVWSGRENFDYQQTLNAAPQPINDAPSASRMRDTLRTFGAALNIPDSQRGTLSSVLNFAKGEFDKLNQRIEALDGERKAALQEAETLRVAKDELTRTTQQEVARLTEQLAQQRSLMDAEMNRKATDIANLQEEVRSTRERLEQAQREHTVAQLNLQKSNDTLSVQNAALVNRYKMVNPPNEPDGRVISASQQAGRAWINLGTADMLPKGTVFRITAPNSDEVKAKAVVLNVQRDRAEVRISELKDRFDPVVPGDEISNDLYSPNLRRTIVLIGRFSYPYTKAQVKMLLESLGNTVVDKPVPGVDMAIVGGDTVNEAGDGFTNIAETEEYKQIQHLGIEVVPLNRVRDFLTLE